MACLESPLPANLTSLQTTLHVCISKYLLQHQEKICTDLVNGLISSQSHFHNPDDSYGQ